ncbi:MAG TPA: autorepressor SdpR family transcription factor [Rhizomicrobium sp.]|nr:autorepressor SdpR family transcription factor [Rhizomicrobium sp.]
MNSVFKALADPTRRRVLELLKAKPMTAGELADNFPFSKPTMSAHFAVLREADLVDVQKTGKTVIYRLKLSVLEDALLGFAGAFGMVSRAAERASQKPANLKKGTTS